MNEVIDFFSGLLRTDLWPPRWSCGEWSSFEGWTYIISNLIIWLSYFSIPATLFIFMNKKSVPFRNIITLFILFILSCGATHLIDAIIFWEPIYRVNTLVLAFTAAISLITAIVLFKNLPRLLSFKSPEELENEISQRKSIEDDYKKLNIKLEKKILERTNELKKANQDLEEFASTVSHDLRSPILSMNELAQFLKEENVSDEAKTIIEKIETSAQKAAELIKDLYELSRNSQFILEKQRIHTSYYLKKLMEELEDNHTITDNTLVEINTEHFIYGDTTLLKQVFINLISNAIKYKHPDKTPKIVIKTEQTDEHTIISVRDNGQGFDMKKHDFIFKLFKRVENSKEGTGIGLSIVKKIIERHEGSIWAESTPLKGSTFFIKLPLN